MGAVGDEETDALPSTNQLNPQTDKTTQPYVDLRLPLGYPAEYLQMNISIPSQRL